VQSTKRITLAFRTCRHSKSNSNRIVEKYGTIYARDACLKTIACNKAEEAAITKIVCKKDEAYNKKALVRTGIVYWQAAKWGVK
jgi:hypothetical protein